jgi:RNA polymerase sigma factor (sigma-70 family)
MTATPIKDRRVARQLESIKPFIYKVAARYAKSYRLEVEDLYQDGLAAAVASLRKWKKTGGANPLSWVHYPVWAAINRRAWDYGRRGIRGGLKEKVKVPVTSFDVTRPGGEDGATFTLHDVIGLWDEHEDYIAERSVRQALACLTAKEREVIVQRFWWGLTLKQVGVPLGLTRERIRQIEAGALKKLHERLKEAA